MVAAKRMGGGIIAHRLRGFRVGNKSPRAATSTKSKYIESGIRGPAKNSCRPLRGPLWNHVASTNLTLLWLFSKRSMHSSTDNRFPVVLENEDPCSFSAAADDDDDGPAASAEWDNSNDDVFVDILLLLGDTRNWNDGAAGDLLLAGDAIDVVDSTQPPRTQQEGPLPLVVLLLRREDSTVSCCCRRLRRRNLLLSHPRLVVEGSAKANDGDHEAAVGCRAVAALMIHVLLDAAPTRAMIDGAALTTTTTRRSAAAVRSGRRFVVFKTKGGTTSTSSNDDIIMTTFIRKTAGAHSSGCYCRPPRSFACRRARGRSMNDEFYR